MKNYRFSLVELMAAMAILALIGTASGAALSGFQRSHDKVVTLSERLERNRKLDKIAELMGNTVAFFWYDEEEDDESLVFDGLEDELFFTAMRVPDANGKGAFVFMHIYVDDEQNLIAEYKDTPLLPWIEMDEQQTNLKKVVLADKVEAITFTYAYYDADGEIEWLEYWDQDDEEYTNVLPLAYGFTVEFENGEKLSYLRRTAGLSAYTGMAL